MVFSVQAAASVVGRLWLCQIMPPSNAEVDSLAPCIPPRGGPNVRRAVAKMGPVARIWNFGQNPREETAYKQST